MRQMAIKPILFNTEMVRAILDGRKTCTRRVIKPQPDEKHTYPLGFVTDSTEKKEVGCFGFAANEYGVSIQYVKPPYRYAPGDILYVRETFAWCPCWDCGFDTIPNGCRNPVIYDSSEIYNDYLPKGLNRITFSEPYQIASITVTGGTAKTVRTNYIEVQMNKAGTCTITGKKYADAKVAYQENVTHLEAGESESVKSFGTITLYNLKNLPDIAKRLLDYYSLRRKIDMKFLLDLEEVGNWINVTDTSGNTSTTLIESQTIDLTGGFIATASCRGYSVVVTENYYAGTELYAGGGGII